MSLIKKPVTGMRDILPEEMRLRRYVEGVIRDTYAKFGFTEIGTPVVESLENLNSKQGGENEKLIFKILKRGEKLKLEEVQTEKDLSDSGLRYDLTVPLVRFFANHTNELPSPFKALQMGYVFRADRPQKGRYRQFMQCDIDILGEASNLAEIELILATTQALVTLGFHDFKVRINDRRILKAMARYGGFEEKDFDSVFIELDKLEKIGLDGVEDALMEDGFEKEQVSRFLQLVKKVMEKSGLDALKVLAETILPVEGEEEEDSIAEVKENLEEIIRAVEETGSHGFDLVFDVTLVRGMSYYTGTIFEVAMPQYGGSCGGGGRYDGMIGKFSGQNTPACGFSIGFERILMILLEEGFQVPESSGKMAFLVEKGIRKEQLSTIIQEAQKRRAEGNKVLLVRMNKNKKFQKEQLASQGYEEIREFYREGLRN